MLTVQNGKGSRSRIGDLAEFAKRFSEVVWPRRCPKCGHEFESSARFPVCPVCRERLKPRIGAN